MSKLFVILMLWSIYASAAPRTVHIEKEANIEQFESWLFEAVRGAAPVQFEFSHPEKRFNPFAQLFEAPASRGDVYFFIGDLTNAWSEEEYSAYFPLARWLSVQGFRAVINPAAYAPDVRDAVQSESTRAIIWSSHGSKDGYVFDKSETPLPQHIFSNNASPGLKHYVLGNCYGDIVSKHYTFTQGSGVHFWTGEIDSDQFFDYLTSRKWREDFRKDLKVRLKKRPPRA